MADNENNEGPTYPVWIYLGGGLDEAEMELDGLDPDDRAMAQLVADYVVHFEKRLITSAENREATIEIQELLDDPWYRFATDLRLARDGVNRASGALRRYRELAPVIAELELAEKPRRYLREAIHAYLFGFDSAALALCGATLERTLFQLFARPEDSNRARTPSMSDLMTRAERQGAIRDSAMAARRIIEQRNQVMHRGMWDDRIVRQLALDHIRDLQTVFAELGTRLNRDS